MEKEEKIKFDILMNEARDLCMMINSHDELGQKINEIFKALLNVMQIQTEKISELDITATEYKNKYEELLKEKEELQEDYNTLYNLYERKKNLLDVIQNDN